MRTQYETEEDLAKERAIAKDIIIPFCSNGAAKLYHTKFDFLIATEPRKLSGLAYGLDWCCVRTFNKDQISCWAEIKSRKAKKNQYRDIMISTQKFVKGRTLSRETGLPFIVFIYFELDQSLGVHLVDLNKTYKIEFNGRTVQTRDAGDIEPVNYILVSEMFFIKDPITNTDNIQPKEESGFDDIFV